jgi:hypothetical protein
VRPLLGNSTSNLCAPSIFQRSRPSSRPNEDNGFCEVFTVSARKQCFASLQKILTSQSTGSKGIATCTALLRSFGPYLKSLTLGCAGGFTPTSASRRFKFFQGPQVFPIIFIRSCTATSKSNFLTSWSVADAGIFFG